MHIYLMRILENLILKLALDGLFTRCRDVPNQPTFTVASKILGLDHHHL